MEYPNHSEKPFGCILQEKSGNSRHDHQKRPVGTIRGITPTRISWQNNSRKEYFAQLFLTAKVKKSPAALPYTGGNIQAPGSHPLFSWHAQQNIGPDGFFRFRANLPEEEYLPCSSSTFQRKESSPHLFRPPASGRSCRDVLMEHS